MTILSALLVAAAGFAAGVVNTVVGSGSLVTYPVLVALGYPPVVANIANTIGLTPGSIAGALSYRSELRVRRRELVELVCVASVGAVAGAALLLVLPSDIFQSVVPGLILIATLLVAIQPRIQKRIRPLGPRVELTFGLLAAMFLTSVYGGYFSAAQGVLILGVLGVMTGGSLQQQNAIKNVLQAVVNLVASAFFVFGTSPAWSAIGLIAVGALFGGRVGAAVGRRMPAAILRAGVLVVGVAAAVFMALYR